MNGRNLGIALSIWAGAVFSAVGCMYLGFYVGGLSLNLVSWITGWNPGTADLIISFLALAWPLGNLVVALVLNRLSSGWFKPCAVRSVAITAGAWLGAAVMLVFALAGITVQSVSGSSIWLFAAWPAATAFIWLAATTLAPSWTAAE